MTPPMTLHVWPDGRQILTVDGDFSEPLMSTLREALAGWTKDRTLIVDGREVSVVYVEPSIEERLTAIEERLGLRPVTVK